MESRLNYSFPGAKWLQKRHRPAVATPGFCPASSIGPDGTHEEVRIRVYLVNPLGIGVITPRWLYVIAGATPACYGDPLITDETLERFDPDRLQPGEVMGIGIHTANAFRGLELGRIARERGAWVIFGGIHATLYPEEAFELGAAHAVVKGDGDGIWATVLTDCARGSLERMYDGGRVPARSFLPGTLGSRSAPELYVGVGADGARMSEALFVLFRLAHRWTATAPARARVGPPRDRRIAAPRLPVHRARR